MTNLLFHSRTHLAMRVHGIQDQKSWHAEPQCPKQNRMCKEFCKDGSELRRRTWMRAKWSAWTIQYAYGLDMPKELTLWTTKANTAWHKTSFDMRSIQTRKSATLMSGDSFDSMKIYKTMCNFALYSRHVTYFHFDSSFLGIVAQPRYTVFWNSWVFLHGKCHTNQSACNELK